MPAPRTGPPPPRRRQHSRKCRTPHTPKASERAAGALPFAAPQGRRQGSQRLRTGPSGPARGRRRSDPRRSAASSRRPRKAHFLRMAFIGASSGAAAFFFLMARRFMPFIAFPFFPPFLIALRIALRIAFAMLESTGPRRAGETLNELRAPPPPGEDHVSGGGPKRCGTSATGHKCSTDFVTGPGCGSAARRRGILLRRTKRDP